MLTYGPQRPLLSWVIRHSGPFLHFRLALHAGRDTFMGFLVARVAELADAPDSKSGSFGLSLIHI